MIIVGPCLPCGVLVLYLDDPASCRTLPDSVISKEVLYNNTVHKYVRPNELPMPCCVHPVISRCTMRRQRMPEGAIKLLKKSPRHSRTCAEYFKGKRN